MFRNFKVLVITVVVLVVAASVYAFAASNTIEDSAAGYAAKVVPGYTVSNIVYDLDATDPTMVDNITFDIAPSSGTVVAAIVKLQTVGGGTWKDCTLGTASGSSRPVTCAYSSLLPLANVTALNIVASSTADTP